MNTKTPEFDEETYLEHNPDVKSAVVEGTFASGFDHYLAFGWRENRAGITRDPFADDECWPLPPTHLRQRVHGASDIESYQRIGCSVAHDIHKLIRRGRVRVTSRARVLDFGSGPGRVMTWMRGWYPDWQIVATDIDAEAIGWARSHLSDAADFQRNDAKPPLRFPDEHFDFVYSISIFTHLPERLQSAWLAELARIARPGAFLVVTTHGGHLRKKAMPSRGFKYAIGWGTRGLPWFYQTSYQTEEYIRQVWSRHLQVHEIIPRGLAGLQDIVICTKRGD